MRDVTHKAQIASRTANRIYDEKIQILFNEIKEESAKETFIITILLRAMADLYSVSLDFHCDLDTVVDISKQQALEADILHHNDSNN